MIKFDVLTLKAFCDEGKEFFEGARINKIQQPTRREFILTLRNRGVSKQFYVNITPEFYHACFMSGKNCERRMIEMPKQPPMFCMLLRKYLESARISRVNVPENERILEFYMETYNELAERIYLCLVFEFMGKHSNVILYNDDTGIILGCAHNVGSEKSREREIYGGIPYVYPPAQNKSDFLKYEGEIPYETLAKDFHMFSGYFANLCNGRSIEEIKSFLKLENLTPGISEDFIDYSIYSNLIEKNIKKYDTVSEMLDDYYAYHIGEHKFNNLKLSCKTKVSQRLKKINKTLEQLEQKLAKENDGDKYRLYGDLLMANLYALNDYSETVSVFDYENSEKITLALDPTKTIKENANGFYKLYNKSKTAKNKLTELYAQSELNAQYEEQVLYSVNGAQTPEDLFEILPEIFEEKEPQASKNKKNKPVEILTLEESVGVILIGKNNKQNDYIISKAASDEDLWFHVHNCAGSHVLLKSDNPTDELILKCAKLAKEYSSVKNSSKIGVIYTKRKYLRKPPGAALGYVTYKNEREIVLD